MKTFLPILLMMFMLQSVQELQGTNLSTTCRSLYHLSRRSLTHRPLNPQAMHVSFWSITRQEYIAAHAAAVERGLTQFTAKKKQENSNVAQLWRKLVWAAAGASGVHLYENHDEYIKKYRASMQKECR